MTARDSYLRLCETFESIQNSENKAFRIEILQRYVSSYPRHEFFDVLRLFLPQLERERGAYRLRETAFTKTLTNILQPTPSDINLLKNYNKGNAAGSTKMKDYADAAFYVVRKKLGHACSNLSIKDANLRLDAIAKGDIRIQENLLLDLFSSISHLEIKWTIRIILKEMHLKISKNDILSSYHQDAPKYLQTNTSLRQLCVDLLDKNKPSSEIEVSMFNAYRPMLSLKCNVKEFNKAVLDGKEFLVEEKFDGERFQVHYDGNQFKYFSRNNYNYTEEFKTHANIIKACIKAQSVILDGEMMIYDKKRKCFGSKGMSWDIKKVKDGSKIQQCFCVFDIVFLNGENLTSKPLSQRKELLSSVITPMEGVIQVSKFTTTRTRQELLDILNRSMDDKQEGIVFKCPMSTYHPGERIGWWKFKHEYFEGVMADLDVLIIGGYYGKGRTRGEIVDFLVAAREGKSYLSFAKMATGLGASELKVVSDHIGDKWLDVKDKEHEHFGVFWGKEVPDKWVKPEHSMCLEIRGSELIKLYGNKPDYKTGYTLRFPRILRTRLDKPIGDCLTLEELTSLTTSSAIVQKLNKRHLTLSDLELMPAKKAKPNVGIPEVEVQSDLLGGMKFHVLSGVASWSKQKVETAIRENGGMALLDVTKDTLCMLVGDDHIRAKTYKGDVDIVELEWLRNVLNEGEFSMYSPLDVVYMSARSKENFKNLYDVFGDSYAETATISSLKRILGTGSDDYKKDFKDIRRDIKEFCKEIGFEDRKVLRGYTVFFDNRKIINNPGSKEIQVDWNDKMEFIENGGCISEVLTQDCDCVIAKEDRFEELNLHMLGARIKVLIYSSTREFIDAVINGFHQV